MCKQPDQEVTQTGLYVQDQMRLGDWIAVVGARQDWLENGTEGSDTQKDDALTYRAGLMYEFGFGLTPYVSYAESFVPVVGTTFGGGTFDPQQGRMYEVGFKYQPVGANFAINGAVYDIAENNRLASDPAHPFFSIQTGAVSIRGLEIEATGRVTEHLKIIAGYSYTDAQYTGGDQEGFNVESVPKHLASLWGIYTFDQGCAQRLVARRRHALRRRLLGRLRSVPDAGRHPLRRHGRLRRGALALVDQCHQP